MIQCRILKTVDDIIAKFALYRQYDHRRQYYIFFRICLASYILDDRTVEYADWQSN